jgi:hypothetical protein
MVSLCVTSSARFCVGGSASSARWCVLGNACVYVSVFVCCVHPPPHATTRVLCVFGCGYLCVGVGAGGSVRVCMCVGVYVWVVHVLVGFARIFGYGSFDTHMCVCFMCVCVCTLTCRAFTDLRVRLF